MLDVTTFLALTRQRTAGIPVALYFHENQLTYPPRPTNPGWSESRRRRTLASSQDHHYPFVNVISALAADAVLWNSAHNRDSFLEALPRFLKHFPDYRELQSVEHIRRKSFVLPLGLNLRRLDAFEPEGRDPGPPLLLWNHRWEYDKGPARFFAALDQLLSLGLEFHVAILGERFRVIPTEFLQARERLGQRVVAFGYAKEVAEYAHWLWQSDVVLSCASHEFFGASVAEAIYCRTWPLLPNRLVYPELIPLEWHDACLYEDFAGLITRLTRAIQHPQKIRQQSLRRAVASFDWQEMAPIYDKTVENLVGAAKS
jgi:glycosyltransferase involved in cell wall biosynthesis